jgi:hypothetical protein
MEGPHQKMSGKAKMIMHDIPSLGFVKVAVAKAVEVLLPGLSRDPAAAGRAVSFPR